MSRILHNFIILKMSYKYKPKKFSERFPDLYKSFEEEAIAKKQRLFLVENCDKEEQQPNNNIDDIAIKSKFKLLRERLMQNEEKSSTIIT
jgi:hypothetical protein